MAATTEELNAQKAALLEQIKALEANQSPVFGMGDPRVAKQIQDLRMQMGNIDRMIADPTRAANEAYGYNQQQFNTAGNIQDEGLRQQRILDAANGSVQSQQLYRGLQGLIDGTGSAAQGVLRGQMQQNVNQQSALSQTAGSNPALQAALAARATASARGSLSNQLANARAAELPGAYAQMTSAVNQQNQSRNQLRGLESNQAMANASLDLERERIRQQNMGNIINNPEKEKPGLLQRGLSAFSQAAGAAGQMWGK